MQPRQKTTVPMAPSQGVQPMDVSPTPEELKAKKMLLAAAIASADKQMVTAFRKETEEAGDRSGVVYQRRFARTVRDLGYLLSVQPTRLISLEAGYKPFRPPSPEDKKSARAAISIFIQAPVMEDDAAGDGASFMGPVEILDTMAQAERLGKSFEEDERVEAMCLAAVLSVSPLKRSPFVRMDSSDAADVMKRDETLQNFLVICWYLLHADNIVEEMSARAVKLTRLVTSINRVLLPSIIRAVLRVKAAPLHGTAAEVVPIYQSTEEELAQTNERRRARVDKFLAQVDGVVRYLWDQGSTAEMVLPGDVLRLQAVYGTAMQNSLPPVLPMILVFANLVADTPRTDLPKQEYAYFAKTFASLGREGMTASRNFMYAAISSGVDIPAEPGSTQSLLDHFAERTRQKQGVTGALLSGHIAIIEALLDLYMVLTVPRSSSSAPGSSEPVQLGAPDLLPPRARMQRSTTGRPSPLPPMVVSEGEARISAFKQSILRGVRAQMATISSIIRSAEARLSATATELGDVALHAVIALQLGSIFGHFFAMGVSLGFYNQQQATLRYFPFQTTVQDVFAGEDSGLMTDIHRLVFQGAANWINIFVQLTDAGAAISRIVHANVLRFLDTVLTREVILKNAPDITNPLPVGIPLKAVSETLVRAEDLQLLMVAKRALRIVLRGFVASNQAAATTPQNPFLLPKDVSFVTRAVEHLALTAPFLRASLAEPLADGKRYHPSVTLGIGNLEEYETATRRNSFDLWSSALGQFLRRACTQMNLTEDVVQLATVRILENYDNTGNPSSDLLCAIYAAAGVLDLLRKQPETVGASLRAAHDWSLQQREHDVTAFMNWGKQAYPGGGGFTLYGTTQPGDLAFMTVEEVAAVGKEPAAAATTAMRYPTGDDVVLSDILSVMLAGVTTGIIDPRWVIQVAGAGLAEIVTRSDALTPVELGPDTSRLIGEQNMEEFREQLQNLAAEKETVVAPEAPVVVSEQASPPPPPATTPYDRLVVIVHTLPESHIADAVADTWSVHAIGRDTVGLLVIGRVCVSAAETGVTAVAEEAAKENTRGRQITVDLLQGIEMMIRGYTMRVSNSTDGAVEFSNSKLEIVLVPCVEAKLASVDLASRRLAAHLPAALAESQYFRTRRGAGTFTAAIRNDGLFVPLLRQSTSADVIACAVSEDALRPYLFRAAHQLRNLMHEEAATTDVTNYGELRLDEDFLEILAVSTLFMYATDQAGGEDARLVCGFDATSMDSADSLVRETHVLVLFDMPAFWAMQMIMDLRSHPQYKPMTIILAYRSKKAFVRALVTHRCMRMETQLNLLHKAIAADAISVVVHPRALIELMGVESR